MFFCLFVYCIQVVGKRSHGSHTGGHGLNPESRVWLGFDNEGTLVKVKGKFSGNLSKLFQKPFFAVVNEQVLYCTKIKALPRAVQKGE